jgi:hypothetical protein
VDSKLVILTQGSPDMQPALFGREPRWWNKYLPFCPSLGEIAINFSAIDIFFCI